jgi:hypothetical protein
MLILTKLLNKLSVSADSYFIIYVKKYEQELGINTQHNTKLGRLTLLESARRFRPRET